MTKRELIKTLMSEVYIKGAGLDDEMFVSVDDLRNPDLPIHVSIDFVADQFINVVIPTGRAT